MGAMTIGVTARDGVIAVAAGLLMAASFPPLGLWPLAFVGVALFLWQLRDHEGEIALNLGLVFGVVYGLGTRHVHFHSRVVPGDRAAQRRARHSGRMGWCHIRRNDAEPLP